MGNSALTYSEKGYGYAMEKAGSTQGWTFTNFEEAFNQGYPQELKHFIECVRNDTPPAHDRRGWARRARNAERRVLFGANRPKGFRCPFGRRFRGQSTCGSERPNECSSISTLNPRGSAPSVRCGGTVFAQSRI